MAEFRKQKHGRIFYKIMRQEAKILAVTNRHYQGGITYAEAASATLLIDDVRHDHDLYQDCTEEEFNAAYKEALEVIQMQKI